MHDRQRYKSRLRRKIKLNQRFYADPDMAIFAKLRLHFTLLTTCILLGCFLGVAFLIAIAMPRIMTLYTQGDLSSQAERIGMLWQHAPGAACPFPPDLKFMAACFDAQGNALKSRGEGVPQFLNNSLARSALQEGLAAQETVSISGRVNYILRYARVVRGPHGNILGVVQLGEWVDNPHSFIVFSLLIGSIILILLAAPLVSVFLANRAIAPARLAFKRQKEFIANASHELRTPLALLRADAEVLLLGREQLTEEDAGLLEDIVSEAVHMTVLANNMLTLARMDDRHVYLEQEVIDLSDVASRVAHRARSLAAESAIALNVKASVVPALVIGDRVMLEQAVLILLDNAIKYNHCGGSVQLSVGVERGLAALEMHDTGVGIAAEHIPHLGERFYRVDKARSRDAGGSGLGLSIARSIISAHHGMLTFSSHPDQGTTATLILLTADGGRLSPTR